MSKPDLPLSFVMNLAQNESALKKYEAMSKSEKADIINKSHNVKSREEMRSFVNSLSDNQQNL